MNVADAGAAVGAATAVVSALQMVNAILGVLAAVASLTWYGIRIYEYWKDKKSADRP